MSPHQQAQKSPRLRAQRARQHFVAMRANRRNFGSHRCLRARHLPGRVHAEQVAGAIGKLRERTALDQMRIGQGRAGIAESGAGNAGRIERGDAFVDGMALGPFLDDLHHRRPVGAAGRHAGKSRIVGQLALARDLAERREIARGHGRDQEVAIPGSYRAIGRTRRADGKLRFLQLVIQLVQHTVHQRDIDALALAGARARCSIGGVRWA